MIRPLRISGAKRPMKVTNESSDLSPDTAYSDRHVTLYPAVLEDPSPGTMEDIKISIVNERATGLKRQREEITAATPCSKKHCSGDFSCSTPDSASLHSRTSPSTSKAKGVKLCQVSTPSRTLEQYPVSSDEWEDSLLQPSDNEDDSPIDLTYDEMESLLEDDSYFNSGLDLSNATRIVTLKSEDEKETLCTAPSQLAVSNAEATLSEEDLDNEATMAPSPSHSVIDPVEVQVSKQKISIVSDVKSSDSVQEIIGMSTSAVPVLDKTEALAELASDSSANLSVHSPNSLSNMDGLLEWQYDSELSFDGDIDNLLATSPGDDTSSEEERAAELYVQSTEQINPAVSDSTSPSEISNSVSVNQAADSDESDTADLVQQSSTSTLHLSDPLNVHCPPPTVPELPEDSGSPATSAVVLSETQANTDAAEDVIPSTSTESDAQSAVDLNDQPVNSSAAQTSSSQETITAFIINSSEVVQERSSVAVTPILRPAHRSFKFSSFDLECDKDNYCDQVLMHIESPEGANNVDPVHELASLLNQISRQNQSWQHPSNFSRRNHPRCGKKPSTRYTLNEWVEENGGDVPRFTNIPQYFQRSPVPEALPF